MAFQSFPASDYAAKFLDAILWPPDAKNQLIEKDPDAGKDCGHEEKGATDSMDSMDTSLSKLWEIVRTRKLGVL